MECNGVIQDERKLFNDDLTSLRTKAIGRKRRAWLDGKDNSLSEEKGSIDPIKETGSIDPKRTGSIDPKRTGSIDPKRTGSIDPKRTGSIDPKELTGSIDPVGFSSLNFSKIRKNPLKVIHFLHGLIYEKNTYITRKVKLKEIMHQVDISRDSSKTALRFLLKNNFISRVSFKSGRSGWSQYQLSKSIYKEIENAIFETGSIDPKETGSNSSSNNNTTTTIRPCFDWEDIDTTPLTPIGLNPKHLLQIKSKIDPKLVQESINHFAYAIHHNPKVMKYKNPLATFITVLKRGESWIEVDYRSPQEIAMMQLVAQKKAERKRIDEMENKLINESFVSWRASLTHEQLEAYISDEARNSKMVGFKESSLKAYFVKQVWSKNIPRDLSDLKKQNLLFEDNLVKT
jgi:hypothetical protein